MIEKFFTIIIKDSNKDTALDSLRSQAFTNWECFVTNNVREDTDKIINGDERIHVINKKSADKYIAVNDAIKQATGKYIIILNSDDYFIPNALSMISQMIIPTQADVVLYGTTTAEEIPELPDKEYKCVYRYLVRREIIMDFVFDSLSGFCFKRQFIQDTGISAPEESFIFNTLANIPAITRTKMVCVLQITRHLDIASSEYKNLIDNYVKYKGLFKSNFWRQYFAILIPRIIDAYVYQHDKQSYIYCAKKIPLKYVPLKYKLAFLLLKITH